MHVHVHVHVCARMCARKHAPGEPRQLRYLRMNALDGKDVFETVWSRAVNTSAIVLNVGSHVAKSVKTAPNVSRWCVGSANDSTSSRLPHDFFDRRVPTGRRGWFVDGARRNKNYTRHILVAHSPTAWRDALEAARLATRGPQCDAALMQEAVRVRDQVMQLFQSLRRRGYRGRLLWRSIQINFGFDNSLKLKINKLLDREWLAAHWTQLGAEHLDVEEMTASRPETFFHEHTNHFFCTCPHVHLGMRGNNGKDIRERCIDTPGRGRIVFSSVRGGIRGSWGF